MLNLNFDPYLNIVPNILYAFVIALIITPLLRLIGLKFGFATKPPGKTKERGDNVKLHKVTISRLGEFAVVIPILLLMWKDLNFSSPQIFGIVTTILFILFIGALDSKYNFSEFIKLTGLMLCSIILVFTGTIINIHEIIDLKFIDIYINNPILNDKLSLLSALFTILWIVIISTAVSYVGGVDGLSEGTTAIAIMILTLIGIRNNEIITITIGSLCFGGLLGLVPYNFYPKIIMSEHLIYGFIIAILAIISKGKIATSILLLIIPILDFIIVFVDRAYRYFVNNKSFNIINFLRALGTPEKNHLHHRFLSLGLNHAQIAIINYFMYAFLGLLAMLVSEMYLAFTIFGSVMFLLLMYYYMVKFNKKL